MNSKEFRAQDCVKVEVAVQGSPSPNKPYGFCGRKVTVKQRARELCESRGGRRGLPVPNSPSLWTYNNIELNQVPSLSWSFVPS